MDDVETMRRDVGTAGRGGASRKARAGVRRGGGGGGGGGRDRAGASSTWSAARSHRSPLVVHDNRTSTNRGNISHLCQARLLCDPTEADVKGICVKEGSPKRSTRYDEETSKESLRRLHGLSRKAE
ncbi:hypothetical protein HZH68_010650 [Vespula germanica]|uniref:Uncharacterized protein n=1 Tax=Vespula germanica TaxID=30212 RepID=A0A834JSV2_VESGE|nr:hypothetical protein HZH68_010650 [Vespula germanica]